MKLHQEDPRLTAFLLGELSSEERRMVEKAVSADSTLKNMVSETRHICEDLETLLGGDSNVLLPKHRDNIRKAAKEAARQGKIQLLASHRKARRVWQVPIAAAAVIVGGIFLLTLIPNAKNGAPKAVATESVPESVPDAGFSSVPKQGNVMSLPLEAGNRSLPLITTAVRIEDRMPDRDEVRIEELINAFPLRAKGAAALWDGCTLAAEILPCPWRPSGNLVLVTLQGPREGERRISLKFEGQGTSVSGHRLMGYSNGDSDVGMGGEASTVSAGKSVALIIEAPVNSGMLGNLTWTVDEAEAPTLELVPNPEKQPSEDASFSTLICAYGLWLRGEGKPMIDDLLVLALAREAASENLVADRYDFITLVDQTVKLAEK